MSSDFTIVIYGTDSYKKNKTIFVNEENFDSPQGDYKSTILGINQLNKIGNSFLEGKSVPEYFVYDEISLWWFLYPELSRRFLKLINFINNFSDFIEKISPNVVKIKKDFTNFELIKQICSKNNIKVEYSKNDFLKFKNLNKIENIARKFRANIITKRKVKKRRRMFFQKKSSIPDVNDKILFLGYPVHRRPIFNFEKGTSDEGEFIIENLMDFIDKKNTIGIDLFSHVSENDKILEERLLESEICWFPIDCIFEDFNKNEKHEKFLKKYSSTLKSKSFQDLFTFRDVNFWKQIMFDFGKMKFMYYLPYWLILIDNLKNFFEQNKPKAIFLMNETGPQSLAFIEVSRKFGIKTIGIQHGIIYDYHISYMHENFVDSQNPFGFPLPTKYLLFGEITKKILLNKGYPVEKLVVFGNPVFFNVKKEQPKTIRKSLFKKYGINEDDQVILFAPFGIRGKSFTNSNYNTQILEQLLKEFKNKKNFFILMKPHPIENSSSYEVILKKYGCTNARIVEDNLLKLIIISSLVVSTFSTSIIDSLCLKKPVVQVNFENVEFHAPYDKFDAVLTTSLNDLSNSILELLKNEKLRTKLLGNASNFIKDYYNIPPQNPKEILEKILE